jgi:hypothetical protein
MRPEDITKKFFNTGDERLLTYMKDKFPKEFDDLRRFQLSKLSDKSTSSTSGDSLPGTFIKQFNSYSPKVREMLLGSPKKISDAEDVKTVYQAMNKYRAFNPSGTGQANSYTDYFLNSVKDLPRMAMLKGMENNTIRNSMDKMASAASRMKTINPEGTRGAVALTRATSPQARFLENPAISDPRILDLVSQNPDMINSVQDPRLKKALQERMPQQEPKVYKGEGAWIARGFENLSQTPGAEILSNEAVIQDLMNTKEGADLLMMASELKPGSPKLNILLEKIKAKHQGTQ